MSAPGVGVGDIISGCVFIYKLCVKYKDAPKEFDEIAEKAKATAVVLERIDAEALIAGNLVERAGPQAYDQLQDNLASLRRDKDKLETIVTKYDKIHDEGPGRRMLFVIKESNSLTDLRQRIGRHEQTLQLWYMTLVYGSLRRLEGGQEDIVRRQEALLDAFHSIKQWSPRKAEKVRESVCKGDTRTLEKELEKSGLDPSAVRETLNVAANYVASPARDKDLMETKVRRTLSTLHERPSEASPYAYMPHDGPLPSAYMPSPYAYMPPGTAGPYARMPGEGLSYASMRPDFAAFDKPTRDRSGDSIYYSPEPVYLTSARPSGHTDNEKKRKEMREFELQALKERERLILIKKKEREATKEKEKSRGHLSPDHAGPSYYETDEPLVVRPGTRLHRSKSTSARPTFPVIVDERGKPSGNPGKPGESFDEGPQSYVRKGKAPLRSGYPSTYPTRGNGREEVILIPESSRRHARRASEAPPLQREGRLPSRSPVREAHTPRSPLLIVPDAGPLYRSASAERRDEGREIRVERVERTEWVQRWPEERRDAPQANDEVVVRVAGAPPRRTPDEDGAAIERRPHSDSRNSNRSRRNSSTHSYVRVREGSQGSQDGEGGGERNIRIVKKMDRIDSMGT